MTEQAAKVKTPRMRPEKSAGGERQLKITLVKSLIGYPRTQREVAKGLGLRKLNSKVVRKATPETLGMIHKISHVLKVEAVEEP